MKKGTIFPTLILALLFLPRIVYGQTTIIDILGAVQQILVALVPLTIGLAVIAVLFGLARYAFRAGDEQAQEEGRRIMFWGVVTLFIMVSIWGFVYILQSFFFGTGYNPVAPDIPVLPTDPGQIFQPPPATG